MAAQIARQVLTTHFDDEEDTFDYVLALALDGEDVTPFLVEACDDDEEAAAALAAKLTDALRLAGHIAPAVSEPEALPPVPEEAATKAPQRKARRSKSPPKPKERRSKSPPKPPPIVAEDDEEAALQQQLDDTDDFASAWSACAAQGKAWGGRGAGGRGVARRYQAIGTRSRDVVVDGVTLAFAGRTLLERTEFRLVAGRRYALLGRNGVGKSTLLRRIAAGALPGFPPHLRVAYVAQETRAPSTDDLPVDAMVASAGQRRRGALEAERDELEAALLGDDADEVAAAAERLCEVEEALAECETDRIRAEAKALLKGVLGFNKALLTTPARSLSGGWRARVALGAALLEKCDVLLLDEPTNHLDLEGVLRLEQRLLADQASPPTILFVSHDRGFVEAVATDVVVFENQQLKYFRGGFAEFEQRSEERAANHERRLDARTRQETAARESAERLRRSAVANKKHTNDNALRQAKQRLAKIERVGLGRDDGKRYKTNSLKALDESCVRLPSRVEAERARREDQFSFPTSLPPAGATALVSLDNVYAGYGGADVLKDMSAQLCAGARVALVGPNGAGKSTLLKVLAGDLAPTSGDVRRRPGVRTAVVSQHHADALRPHAASSAATLFAERHRCSDLEARGVLGRFGLGGAAATLPLQRLSGGQKARVSLADLTWDAPHVLLLDEPTNHLDMQALDALAAGLRDFDGAVVVVSHNRAFLQACCTELWVLDGNGLDCREGAFDDQFASYASDVLGTGGAGAAATAMGNASRKARALDAASAKGRKRGPKAGGAAQRTALM
jgi:ATP-binding cassette subfamily F protein 3